MIKKNFYSRVSSSVASFASLVVLALVVVFASGCGDELSTTISDAELHPRAAASDGDLLAETCHDPQLHWTQVAGLVDLSGDIAYFETEDQWYDFRSQVSGLTNEDRVLLKASFSTNASFDLLHRVYDEFYDSVEQDTSEDIFFEVVESHLDVLQIIDRPDGEQELVHLYESMDPTGDIVDRKSIFKVNDQYGKLLGGTVVWSDDYDALASLAVVPDQGEGANQTELYTIIDEDDIVEPRSSCGDLNVTFERLNEINRRWCRNDRRVAFSWKLYESTAFEVDRGTGIKDKFIDVRANFLSRTYKRFGCVWGRYKTTHYRRNADFDVVVKYKDNSGNTISEFDFEPYTAPQRINRSARSWEDDVRLLTYLKDNSFKVEACWTKERIDVSSRPFGENNWLIINQ